MARFGPPLHGLAGRALRLGTALALCLLLAAPAAIAGKRQAKKAYKQARQAELQRDYDKALELFEQAAAEDPEHEAYKLAVRRIRFVAGQFHVDQGQKIREQGQIQEALREFQIAIQIDPSSSVATQEYRRTLEMLEDEQKGDRGEDEPASALERERQNREDKIGRLRTPPRLQPLSTQPINLNIPSQETKVVFETIGKLAGINVLFDSEYTDKKVTVELQNATLYEALDYVSLLAKSFWKTISHNAIFVTNDNTNKRRDYEEEIVKTFYLTNVATPQEMQEIMTAIRGLTDIRRMFPVNSMNAMVIRGTRSKLALAEKVINDVDKARAEVVIDVLVVETSKSKTRELGITPVSGGAPGIDIPIIFQPQNGIGEGGNQIQLSELGSISSRDWVTTLPNFQIKALLSSSDSRVLQSPRVRAADSFQASLRIGDRIPIATGSFQPGIGGVGINPLVNTQFNYEDVGVNVDLTPKVHNDHEVSLHVEIEISNVKSFVDIGGISQPVIGQRTISHDIRIREGEASVLGGLNQTQTFVTKSGVPFLGEVPLLGYFFSNKKTEVKSDEILIVLIPHIVRQPQINKVNLRGISSGTDQVFQVREDMPYNGKPALPPVGERVPQPEEASPAVAQAQPGAPVPTPAAPAPATPSPAEAAPAPVQPEEPVEEEEEEEPAAAEAEPAGPGARLAIDPRSPEVAVGEQVSIDLRIENVTQLFGAPIRIRYDRKTLRLVDITKGGFLGADGQDIIFARNIRAAVGQAAVNISRFPGTGGSDGNGVLITLVFEGLAAGAGTVHVTPTAPRDAEAKPIQLAPAEFSITVR